MKIHRQFCVDHAGEVQTYAQGFWGLNASDGPGGYIAYGVPDGPDDGTVSPTGAISSITFTPELAISAARSLYDKLGAKFSGAPTASRMPSISTETGIALMSSALTLAWPSWRLRTTEAAWSGR